MSSSTSATYSKHRFCRNYRFVESQFAPIAALAHCTTQDPHIETNSVIRADCIKFIMTFRSQLPKDMHLALLPLIIAHLHSKNKVVSTYAACMSSHHESICGSCHFTVTGCVERAMILRVDKHPVIGEADIASQLSDLFSGLFAALSHPGNHENEYIMRGSANPCIYYA